MKLSKIIDPRFMPALRKLLPETLPLKTAFKLKGIVKKVDEAIENYEDLRKVALKKYAILDEKGELVVDDKGNAQFEDGQLQKFVKELEGLVNVEIDFPKVKLEDLGDELRLSVDEVMVLEDLIEG